MSTGKQVLYLLKTRGPQTAQQLAALLEITSMGARRQLEAAEENGLVAFEDVADKVGRPARRWALTGAGHARFPDRHADLTLQMIEQVRSSFGEAGMEQLIAGREQASEADYRAQLAHCVALPERVEALAAARAAEGYMAEAQPLDNGAFLLIENHCPICAAAAQCQTFCRSELDIFQRVLGQACQVERTEHLLSGARRCVYLIRPLAPA